MRLAGINVNGYRTAAIIMSTVIAAAGVVVYSQSYGILHLYDGPFMMSFPAVSAIVIGGASPRKATVANAPIGTFLYQTTYLCPFLWPMPC
ncbi:MAG: ABC transporter permease subunit [Enterocloster clostridioformis]